MIDIVALGSAASAIASNFNEIPQYNVYNINSSVTKNTKNNHKIETFSKPEDYEQNIPDLSKFFKTISKRVQFIIVGSSGSSNYSLGVLEQLADRQVEVFYIMPDVDMLTGVPKMVNNVVFGVLQEYARSGLLSSFTILSNLEIEESLGDIPIRKYYESINKSIFSCIHYLNFFEHTEPEIGMISKPTDINRIRSVGMLNMKNLEEKWFFELDMPRNVCYYLCINKDRIENDGGLHRSIVEKLKKKPTNAFKKISYAIFETPHEDFGFCVAHTNAIQQQQKTLDKFAQE